MRRSDHWPFRLCSTGSLLLLVAACGLWVRSYRAADAIAFPWRGDLWRLVLVRGRVVLDDEPRLTAALIEAEKELKRRQVELGNAAGFAAILEGVPPGHPLRARMAAVVGYHDPDKAKAGDDAAYKNWLAARSTPRTTHGLPLWIAAVASAVLPAIRVTGGGRRWLVRSRRVKSRLCADCGYDLRASPGRCPECGVAAASRADEATTICI